MKKIIIIIVVVFMGGICFGGINEFYTFNATSGTYSPITGNIVSGISADNAISSPIPLGFTFPYGNNTYTEIKISSNGWVGLGNSITSSELNNELNSITIVPVIAALWDDCSLISGSCVYLLTGNMPNRVFTIQYNHLKWNYLSDSYFNFQIKLYENGKIAFIYGNNTGMPNNPSASIGINMLPGGNEWFYSITPGNPATASFSNANNSVSSYPGLGVIYEFNPVIGGAHDLRAMYLTGDITPTVGQEYNYNITIRNCGANPETDFQVRLVLGTNNIIGNIGGTLIQPGEMQIYTISWIPSTPGHNIIYGEIILPNDENPINNVTNSLNLFVQPEDIHAINIGDGSQLSHIPLSFFYKNSLYECLYYPEELNNTNGTIISLIFYNSFLETPLNGNTKIWLGTTTQMNLDAGWIPASELTQVFEGNVTYPAGQNIITIPLPVPYFYSGGNLVMMIQRPMDTQYYSSLNYFYAQSGGVNRARKAQSNTIIYNPENPPSNSIPTSEFPKTTILFSSNTNYMDLACLNISGNNMPNLYTTNNYTITIRNNGSLSQENYMIKLIGEGGIELSSIMGSPINPSQTMEFSIPWIPMIAGLTYIYGEIVASNDNIVFNNQTSHFNVIVLEPNIHGITIGAGNLTEHVPIDFSYNNSLFEGIYYANELNISSGLITSLIFYNNFEDCPYNGATKIWLGNTTQSDLSSGWIPSTQLTLVFDGNVNYPAGINTIIIPLQIPYHYNGTNIVMMIQRPMDSRRYSYFDFFYSQSLGNNRALMACNVSIAYDPAFPPGWVLPSNILPKTTFLISTQEIMNDLSCISISGPNNPRIGNPASYIISVRNNGVISQNNYVVKLMKEGGIVLGSVIGSSINSLEIRDYIIQWTPSETGSTYLYGEVDLINDEIITNDESPHLLVTVYPQNTLAITIGSGNNTAPMPVHMFCKNSLFETIYQNSEINARGLLTDIQFYNNFVSNITNKPINIWVGETNNTDLSESWISSTQLTSVFSGNVNFPSGQNNILIHFTTPYSYSGRNLVIMVERPMDTEFFNSNDLFRCQTGTISDRTRNVSSDNIDFNPANPPNESTPEDVFPMTTLIFDISAMGYITGTVYDSNNIPLYNATVSILGTNITCTTNNDGIFNLNYVPAGTYQVKAFKFGYYDVINSVTVIPNEVVVTNFILTPLPQVTITGRIIGSDQPQVGLANATFRLSGFANYQTSTNTSGYFTINNVYANHIYNYMASAPGYQNRVGELNVGDNNIDMGEITLLELALPPTQVIANEIPSSNSVSITWCPPSITNIDNFSHDLYSNNNSQNIKNNRILTGYKLWRLLEGQQNNESAWISLTNTSISDTTFVDLGWINLPDGIYQWAVKSIYTNDIQSEAAFSNTVYKVNHLGTIAGVVRNSHNAPIAGAIVTCENITATSNTSGAYSMLVPAGTHTVSVFASGYLPATQENITIIEGFTTTVNFVLNESVLIFQDGFESYTNFALSFAPWTLIDVDQSNTVGIQNVTFPNSGSPMAYIIFVPSATTPPLTGANPHSGIKEAASFASINPPNNDWLISPLLHYPVELKFWARSYTNQYGLKI